MAMTPSLPPSMLLLSFCEIRTKLYHQKNKAQNRQKNKAQKTALRGLPPGPPPAGPSGGRPGRGQGSRLVCFAEVLLVFEDSL